MFNRLRLLIENNDLKSENKQNREYTDELELQRVHAKLLAEYTLTQLEKLEQIDRSGNSKETKQKNRNVILNNLRKENINIIKELSNKFGSGR